MSAKIQITCCAGFLLLAATAQASIITYAYPDSTYTSRTTRIELDPPSYLETGAYSSIDDGTLAMAFSAFDGVQWSPHDLFLYTAGPSSGWPAGWGDAPATEGYSPDTAPQVLYTDFGYTSILLNFSRPLATFGLEVQPDRTPGGPYAITASFYSGATLLGTIERDFGDSDATLPITALLLAGTSDGAPITSVLIAGWDNNAQEGVEWAGARFRYELAPSGAAAPEPASWFLFATGIAVILGRPGRTPIRISHARLQHQRAGLQAEVGRYGNQRARSAATEIYARFRQALG